MLSLVKPDLTYLAGYKNALERGWPPDELRPQMRERDLAFIKSDAAAFIDGLDMITDRPVLPDLTGVTFTLPDGSQGQRLPGYSRWLWDGEFCGSINFRWQPGTTALPAHVSGHIGYSVVPWKQRRGYATTALRLLLPETQRRGLAYVELTTAPDNIVSQKVIAANGGILIEEFQPPPAYGPGKKLRYRIPLPTSMPQAATGNA